VAQLGADMLEGSVDDNEFMREAYLAQIENLEAQRNVIQRELERATVLAPVSGPILMKFVDAGRMLMAGTPLVQLGDLASSEIFVDVLSEEVVRIPVDARVEITGKALRGRTIEGRVRRIYPAAYKRISALGIEQQRVRILVDYDAAANPLRPGTSLDVKIITGTREDAVAVPERALFEKDGQNYVFRVNRNGAGSFRYDRAELVPVTVSVKNDQWAAIEEGLPLGDTIIVEPMNELETGTRVQPKN
jgi:HlyD family secretion protein